MLTSWRDRLRSWVTNWRHQQHQGLYSGHMLLPSDLTDVPFRAHLQVAGLRFTAAASSHRAAACEQVRELAAEVTTGYTVLHWQEAEYAVNLMLARGPVGSGGALAGASAWVSLRVDPGATQAAEEHAKMRQASVLVREGHRLKQQQWSYLRDEVLSDPGNARLWWLDGDRDRLKELVSMVDVFEGVAELLAPTPAGRVGLGGLEGNFFADQVSDLLRRFLVPLEPAQHQLLLLQLGRVFRSYERDDLADELSGDRGQDGTSRADHQ
jgi:hypothetical protein